MVKEKFKIIYLSQSKSIHGVAFTFMLPGESEERRMDVYNWSTPFIGPALIDGNLRLASLEDIAAFKLETTIDRKTKKDYLDIATLLEKFSFTEMVTFYTEKYPNYSVKSMMKNLLDTAEIELSPEPVMLSSLTIKTAVEIIKSAVTFHLDSMHSQKEEQKKEDQKRAELVKQKHEKGKNKGKGLSR